MTHEQTQDTETARRPGPGTQAATGGGRDRDGRTTPAAGRPRETAKARRERLDQEANRAREAKAKAPGILNDICAAIAKAPQAKFSSEQTAVYLIVHRESLRRYVGFSEHVGTRITSHKSHLKAGKHHNVVLQREWSACGPDAFRFGVAPLELLPFGLRHHYGVEHSLINISGDASYNRLSERLRKTASCGAPLKSGHLWLTADEWRELHALGGAAWIREKIRKAKD